jgi:hypothetical protein
VGNAGRDPGDRQHNAGARQWFYVAGLVALVAVVAWVADLLKK